MISVRFLNWYTRYVCLIRCVLLAGWIQMFSGYMYRGYGVWSSVCVFIWIYWTQLCYRYCAFYCTCLNVFA